MARAAAARLRVVAQAEGTRFRSDRNAQNDVRMPATIELAVAPGLATATPTRRAVHDEASMRAVAHHRGARVYSTVRFDSG